MIYLLDILVIVFLFVLFAISHSLLASFNVKERLSKKIGNRIAFYRFFYNISSIIFFIAIYFISPKPNYILYDLVFPYDIIVFIIQVMGVIGFFWTLSFIDVKEFLGINQIIRYYKGNYKTEHIDEKTKLVVKGPFRYSRHPLYFFSIVILVFRSTMDLFYLIFLICCVLYFYIGSVYEEKNLLKKFGDEYFNYKRKTSRIIPFLG